MGNRYSPDYTAALRAHGIVISMSRRGNSYLRVVQKKCEEVYRGEHQDPEDARARIGTSLEHIYNQQRLHSALQYRPPAEFERLQPAPAAVQRGAEVYEGRGKPIHGDEGTAQLDRAPLIYWMSFRLAIAGGVLSSMARFRFTSQHHAATKSQRRSTPKQRMANRGLTRCLSPGVQFNNIVMSTCLCAEECSCFR